jgi:hypothetical protein
MPRNIGDYRSFPYRAGGSALSRASADALWQVVAGIGGANRYYTLNALWTVRELMDAAVGGPGLRHGRPAQDRELRAGDRIDSWRVLVAERPQRLALVFGMKAPGRGVLEFRIAPEGAGQRVHATAYWDPDGLAGRLYWRAMQPAHLVLFDRLTREISRRAEAGDAPARTRRRAPAALSG